MNRDIQVAFEDIRFLMTLSLRLTGLLWDAAMFVAGNTADAARFYHEAVSEVMELVRP